VSYQQFRHFNPTDTQGLSDTSSYIELALTGSTERPEFRSRILVPGLASVIRVLLAPVIVDQQQQILLAFYIVNFVLMLLAVMLFHEYLEKLGFSTSLACLGGLLFVTSRVVVYCTALPLVDSIYFLGIVTLLSLHFSRKKILFYVFSLIFILGKEAILPFCLLPVLSRERSRVDAFLPLLLSIFFLSYRYSTGAGFAPLFIQVQHYLLLVPSNCLTLFSLKGAHQLIHGYSLLLLLAGAYLLHSVRNETLREKLPEPSRYILLVTAVYVIFIPNAGRVAFSAFPVVISASLLLIERVFSMPKASVG
jgi:hypothetical protein